MKSKVGRVLSSPRHVDPEPHAPPHMRHLLDGVFRPPVGDTVVCTTSVGNEGEPKEFITQNSFANLSNGQPMLYW